MLLLLRLFPFSLLFLFTNLISILMIFIFFAFFDLMIGSSGFKGPSIQIAMRNTNVAVPLICFD
jgi:hypothetical protein